MKVLVVPGTTRVAFEVLNSLRSVKGVFLIGAGSEVNVGKSWVYDEFYFLPMINDSSIWQVENLILHTKADFLILANDDWLLKFASVDKIGNAQVIISGESAIQITSFKSNTYKYFRGLVQTPKLYGADSAIFEFPLFVKPDRGQGSRNTSVIRDQSELETFLLGKNDLLIMCQFLEGDEFTVDCFSNQQHHLLYVACRIRQNFSSGISMQTSYVVQSSFVEDWAKIFSYALEIKGAWFFQFKLDKDGNPVLMEIGLRIAGASGISRLRGVNLSLLNLHLFSQEGDLSLYGQSNLASINIDDSFKLGFDFQEIYVDLDDTLVVNGRLNGELIQYLREMNAKGLKISLITRNLNPEVVMKEHAVLFEITNEIIRVSPDRPKSSYINCGKRKFLFIDDSHKERYQMKSEFADSVLVLDQSFCWQRGVSNGKR